MIYFKLSFAACLVSLGLCGAGAPACSAKQKGARQDDGPANNMMPQRQGSAQAVAGQESTRGQEGEMKVLAEGSYGEMGPFVAVAREPRVYAVLRGMAPSLPELDADFFKSNAVAAVFIGQRNTGGYAVEIRHEGGGLLLVSEHAPPADAITTQVITHPFKVVSVPVKEGERVALVLQGGLAAGLLRPYRVASGELTSDGPHAGERLRLEGGLGLARHEALLTIFFDLKGASRRRRAVLHATATGFVEADGRFTIAGFDSRALAAGAAGPLRVTGRLTGDGERLQLTFESAASGAVGKLEAVATGPAPARNKTGASIY